MLIISTKFNHVGSLLRVGMAGQKQSNTASAELHALSVPQQ